MHSSHIVRSGAARRSLIPALMLAAGLLCAAVALPARAQSEASAALSMLPVASVVGTASVASAAAGAVGDQPGDSDRQEDEGDTRAGEAEDVPESVHAAPLLDPCSRAAPRAGRRVDPSRILDEGADRSRRSREWIPRVRQA